jgi:hypothetical protein
MRFQHPEKSGRRGAEEGRGLGGRVSGICRAAELATRRPNKVKPPRQPQLFDGQLLADQRPG